MTDQEILKIDFYDLCGIGAVGMTDADKINYWRAMEKNRPYFNEGLEIGTSSYLEKKPAL